MNKTIIDFYMTTNILKHKIRTGWEELGISSERLESVAEHIYGCLMLAIAIDSEYKLDLDMYKVLKMISLHELEETIIKDYTIRDNLSIEEKLKQGRESVIKVTENMLKQTEIIDLLDEFNNHLTKESKFCYYVDKIEWDFQAKIYDLNGKFSLDMALEDSKFMGEDGILIKERVKTASDVGIECDKKIYKGNQIFESLVNDIQNMKKIDYI